MKLPKKIKSEIILKTVVGDISKTRYKTARTNIEHDYITFDFPNWVVIVATTADNKFVTIKQFRHGSKKIEIEFPGGCIDKTDSSPAEAAIRELREETGYIANSAKIIGKVCPNPALQGNYCYTVLLEDVVKSDMTELEDTEDIETFLSTKEELLSFIKDGSLQNGLVINCLQFYDIFQKENNDKNI